MVSNGSSLKIDFSLIPIIVFASRKNLWIKQYCFQYTKNLISLARIKDWLKNMLKLKNKLLSLKAFDSCPKKMEKNNLH